MGPRPLWKLFCWATFMEEFCEVRATMQESNREVGIISSDSYYFFYIITANEKSFTHESSRTRLSLKELRHSLPSFFQVHNFQSLLIFAILKDSHSVLTCSCLKCFLPQNTIISSFYSMQRQLFATLKITQYRDVTPKMLRYRLDYS